MVPLLLLLVLPKNWNGYIVLVTCLPKNCNGSIVLITNPPVKFKRLHRYLYLDF
jgi:hypothetical protein